MVPAVLVCVVAAMACIAQQVIYKWQLIMQFAAWDREMLSGFGCVICKEWNLLQVVC